MVSPISPPATSPSGLLPVPRYSAISSTLQPRPVSLSGVMLGTSEPSGPLPLGLPARNRELSVAMVMVRGVWHSPQWATARTRYSPRATPDAGALGGGVSRGAKAASQAGRNTLSNSGTVIFFVGVARLTG